jgi:kynurenine formamidase
MTQLTPHSAAKNQQSHKAFSCMKEQNECRSLLSSINKKTFTHFVFDSRRHLIPSNATVDEVHILELVSLSTRQYQPSFMPGDEHHQSVF